jgi:putative transposase
VVVAAASRVFGVPNVLGSGWPSAVVGYGCYVADEREYRFSMRISGGAVPDVSRRVIGGRIEARLKDVIAEKGAWLIEVQTMPDHVQLLVEVDPQFGIHKLMKAIKGRSSRVLDEEFSWLRPMLPSLWTNSYFVATVGGAPLSVIKRYVENQKSR